MIDELDSLTPDFSAHSEGPSRDVVLHLTTGRIHNKNVSTHLIGSISKGRNSNQPARSTFVPTLVSWAAHEVNSVEITRCLQVD